MSARIRRKSAEEWGADPILSRSEIGVNTDTGQWKFGIGRPWSQTPYQASGGGGDTEIDGGTP